MNAFGEAVLANAVLAGVLAVAVGVATRHLRRPAVAYWLWMLVLLKLVTPPLFHVPVPLGDRETAGPRSLTEIMPGSDVPQHLLPADRGSQSSSPPVASRARPQPGAGVVRPCRQPVAGPAEPAIARQPPGALGSIPWTPVLLGLSLIGSICWFALAAVRLAHFGRAISRWQPAPEHLQTAARQISQRFQIRRPPELRVIAAPLPPLLWWSRLRPVIVLPDDLVKRLQQHQQAALVAHELAHYRRGDHLARLLTTIILGLFWWHPAVWWAERRLQQAEEECCDAWVVWALPGRSRSYARSLLAAVEFLSRAGHRLPVGVSGLGQVGQLKRRVELILAGRTRRQMSWAALAALVLLAAVTLPWTLRASSAQEALGKTTVALAAAAAQSAAARQPAGPALGRLSGTVRGPDGAAVAGAEVYLEVHEPVQRWNTLSPSALPAEEEAKWERDPKHKFHIVGRAQTDAAGRFTLDRQSPPAADEIGRIVAAARHFGLAIQSWDGKATELEIRLPTMVVIEGRLLSPDRTPAADVLVKAVGLFRGTEHLMGGDQSLAENDYPPYWPQPVRSNADGGFTLTGMPSGCCLGLDLTHPSFAREEVWVDTGQGHTEGTRGFEIPLLPPTFTHVLEPPRPVEGVVTAADTGKPLAGVPVSVTPMNRHGGGAAGTQTDAAGHFRVSDKVGEMYFVHVSPRPDSGYLSQYVHVARWPQGAKTLVCDFKLARGALIHGRVLDGASGEPIAGASVEYHPSPKNPNLKTGNRGTSYEFRNPVLTDGEGRFKLVGLQGAGYLTVETPQRIYIRKPLEEEQDPNARAMPMGYTPIDLAPPAGANKEVVIRLQRGRTVALQAVGPQGERLPAVTAAWQGRDALHGETWNHGESFPQGTIVLRDVDPERTTRVFMIDPQRKIGAACDITAQTPAGPVEVRLQPCATITGQAVSEDGEPADAQAYLSMCFDPEVKRLSTKEPDIFRYQLYDNFTYEQGHFEPIPGGRFSFDNVLPGIPLAVTAWESDGRSCTVAVEPLGPGEHRDLGRVVLRKSKRE
jgi:beta-lactamase regulating signal transducer with metallopeptidase domain/protocatechuate 3,4-dioxygenase beta subunit